MCGYALFKDLRPLAVKIGAEIDHKHIVRDHYRDTSKFRRQGDLIDVVYSVKDDEQNPCPVFATGTWGTDYGAYNARSESIEAVWPQNIWHPAVVEITQFAEGGKRFIPFERNGIITAALADDSRQVVIVTDAANQTVGAHHGRMPYFLTFDGAKQWLGDEPLRRCEKAVSDFEVY